MRSQTVRRGEVKFKFAFCHMAAALHVSESSPAVKIAPKWDKLVYAYAPSKDGIDENLLILLHGFGTVFRIAKKSLIKSF